MHVVAESLQCVAAGLVKVAGIFCKAVIRCQVHAAAKPPDCWLAFRGRGKEAHIHVHGRGVGIAWMQYQRHAHRFPIAAGEFRAIRRSRGRQVLAHHM
ncbi:hypothetical protein D3C81_1889920 [compost metagenome]